jgi:antitoxin component of MazEF toxin-antitoxin module
MEAQTATQHIKTIGGSLGVIIPADLARKAGMKKDQHVDVTYSRGAIVIARKPDWESFFARDFGIPSDFEFEREDFEDRDIFGPTE